jgi:hypothetical protein
MCVIDTFSVTYLMMSDAKLAVAACAVCAGLVDSPISSFYDVINEEVRDFLRRHVYTRYTQPPFAQLLQRQYGHPAARHRHTRYVYCRIEEPTWRDHAAEAEAAAASLAAEAESAEADIAHADADMVEVA